MDRFIDAPRDCLVLIDEIFKIQYGQIYRVVPAKVKLANRHLKSNMDRFIDNSNIQEKFMSFI